MEYILNEDLDIMSFAEGFDENNYKTIIQNMPEFLY